MDKEKIKFFIGHELYTAALMEAAIYSKECHWLLENQVHTKHSEYEKWVQAVKTELKRVIE